MNQIVPSEFLNVWRLLELKLSNASKKLQVGTSGSPIQLVASQSECDELITILCKFEYQCLRLGLFRARNLCGKFLNQLKDPAWHNDLPTIRALIDGQPKPPMPKTVPLPGFETIQAQLRIIFETAGAEMQDIRMVVIYDGRAKYLERDDLMGNVVKEASSSIVKEEIKMAGNCLSMDLNTAAVFHLMRVAEYALHSLATHLQPGKHRATPLEYSEWARVISEIRNEIENELNAQKASKRGPARDQELEHFRGLLDSLHYFKDAYRNPVAHLRGKFTADEAARVFDRVCDLMNRTAKTTGKIG